MPVQAAISTAILYFIATTAKIKCQKILLVNPFRCLFVPPCLLSIPHYSCDQCKKISFSSSDEATFKILVMLSWHLGELSHVQGHKVWEEMSRGIL